MVEKFTGFTVSLKQSNLPFKNILKNILEVRTFYKRIYIHLTTRQITFGTKLCILKYKLLHKLYKIKMSIKPRRSFCLLKIRTPVYLFFFCTKLKFYGISLCNGFGNVLEFP